MDRRGGCCIAPASVYDMSKVNYIMLRYRPIAPKPAAPGSVPAVRTVPETKRGTRRKRGDCRSKTAAKCSRKTKAAPAPEEDTQSNYGMTDSCCSSVSFMEWDAATPGKKAVTLPLLPEKPERRESPASGTRALNFVGNGIEEAGGCHVSGHVGAVGTWVTVEDVTDGIWGRDGWALGRTDKERVMNLARDTCPGFLSDGLNRVTWANAAYWEMVGHSGGSAVVMGEGVEVPPSTAEAFTCRVRVVTCGGKSRVLLCDAWRMDGGGYAWRLDTELSLTLGLDNRPLKQTALQTKRTAFNGVL